MSDIWTNVTDPEGLPKISVTELGNLLRCTKKHDYAYRQGLRKADPPSFLGKGKYMHTLMERWLSTWVAFDGPSADDIIAEVMPEIETPIDPKDKEQLDRQFRDFAHTIDMRDVGIIGVEQEFMVDVGLYQSGGIPVMIHGFFDAVLEGGEGYYLAEHKTAGRAWSQGQFAWDFQSRLYSQALRSLGYDPVVGTIWNFFYPKRWDQITTYTSPDEEVRFLAEVQQALRLRDSEIILRQPHWGCNDCWFRDLCHAELLGTEDGYIRRTQYVVDEDKIERFAE